jgi:hypothetical protein
MCWLAPLSRHSLHFKSKTLKFFSIKRLKHYYENFYRGKPNNSVPFWCNAAIKSYVVFRGATEHHFARAGVALGLQRN